MRFAFFLLFGVFLMVSLSSLRSVSFSSSSVVVARLGWSASSRSVLLWVVGSSVPVVCRVGSAPAGSPRALEVSSFVAFLRAAVVSGAPVFLGVRGRWASSGWFCAAQLAPVAPRRRLPVGLAAKLAALSVAPVPAPVTAWGVPVPA